MTRTAAPPQRPPEPDGPRQVSKFEFNLLRILRFFLGYFRNEIEAARVHDRKAVELMGESAQVNFAEEWPAERRAQVYAQRNAGGREKGGVKRKATRKRKGNPLRGRGHKSRVTHGEAGS